MTAETPDMTEFTNALADLLLAEADRAAAVPPAPKEEAEPQEAQP